MSYISNLNKIDHQLKQVFEGVKMDNNDFRMLNITLSTPTNENVNSNLELKMFINQSNLNIENPTVEWGYYTNPNDLTNSIKFRNGIDSISSVVEQIVNGNRLDESYLDSIKDVESINENVNNDEPSLNIENINESYKLTEGRLNLNESKVKSYFKTKYGVIIESVSISYRDVNSGMIRKPSFTNANNPVIGDECEIQLEGLSGDFNSSTWVKIENDIRKIPFVEDVNSSTYKQNVDFSFSTKVFVEVK